MRGFDSQRWMVAHTRLNRILLIALHMSRLLHPSFFSQVHMVNTHVFSIEATFFIHFKDNSNTATGHTGIMLDYNCRDASLQYLTFVYYIQGAGAPIKTEDKKCTRWILGYYEAFYAKKNMQWLDAPASLAPLNIKNFIEIHVRIINSHSSDIKGWNANCLNVWFVQRCALKSDNELGNIWCISMNSGVSSVSTYIWNHE